MILLKLGQAVDGFGNPIMKFVRLMSGTCLKIAPPIEFGSCILQRFFKLCLGRPECVIATQPHSHADAATQTQPDEWKLNEITLKAYECELCV